MKTKHTEDSNPVRLLIYTDLVLLSYLYYKNKVKYLQQEITEWEICNLEFGIWEIEERKKNLKIIKS
jgi:hypothetical protein